jgi:hypothetical protein
MNCQKKMPQCTLIGEGSLCGNGKDSGKTEGRASCSIVGAALCLTAGELRYFLPYEDWLRNWDKTKPAKKACAEWPNSESKKVN